MASIDRSIAFAAGILTAINQLFFVGEVLYLVTTILLKICVGILLLSIAIVPTHIWILRFLLFTTILFGLMYLTLIIFQCKPVHIFWEEGPRTQGRCVENSIVLGSTYTATILNCIADWTFGTLPLFIVWSLEMRMKTKLSVAVLLSFASMYVGAIPHRLEVTFDQNLLTRTVFFFFSASIATIIRAVTIPGLLSEKNFLRTLNSLRLLVHYTSGVRIDLQQVIPPT